MGDGVMAKAVENHVAAELLQAVLDRVRDAATEVDKLVFYDEMIITGTDRTEAGESFIRHALTGRRTLTIIYTVPKPEIGESEVEGKR